MLQFITHANNRYTTLQGAKIALEGGCKWIQLRMKGATKNEMLMTAVMLKQLCWGYQATLLVDDHVDVCLEIGLDGVHLGKSDMDPAEARQILGANKIIGGTANTIEDILMLADKKVDYIGLGPFRFTHTKENLSPVLGLDGYKHIMQNCKDMGITIPIIAIGGITIADIPSITETGIGGIALSSSIIDAPSPIDETKAILKILNSSY